MTGSCKAYMLCRNPGERGVSTPRFGDNRGVDTPRSPGCSTEQVATEFPGREIATHDRPPHLRPDHARRRGRRRRQGPQPRPHGRRRPARAAGLLRHHRRLPPLARPVPRRRTRPRPTDRRRLSRPRRRPRGRALVGHGRGRRRHQLRRAAGNHPRRPGRAKTSCVAVGRCWASLDTERAVAYRRKSGRRATTGWRWPSSCSGWCRPRWPASCSRAIRSTPRAGGCSSRRRGASARASSPAASRRIAFTSTATPGRSSNGTSAPRRRRRRRPASQPVPADKQNRPCLDDAQLARAGGTGPAGRGVLRRPARRGMGVGRRPLLAVAGPADHHGRRRRARAGAPRGDRGPGGAGRAGRHGLEPLQPVRSPARADADDLGHRAPLHVRPRRLRPDVPRPRLRSRPVVWTRTASSTWCAAGPTATSAASRASTPAGCRSSTPSPRSRRTRARPFTRSRR